MALFRDSEAIFDPKAKIKNIASKTHLFDIWVLKLINLFEKVVFVSFHHLKLLI